MILENLTGKFGLKTSGNYNSKELSLKADGIKFQLVGERETSSTRLKIKERLYF